MGFLWPVQCFVGLECLQMGQACHNSPCWPTTFYYEHHYLSSPPKRYQFASLTYGPVYSSLAVLSGSFCFCLLLCFLISVGSVCVFLSVILLPPFWLHFYLLLACISVLGFLFLFLRQRSRMHFSPKEIKSLFTQQNWVPSSWASVTSGRRSTSSSCCCRKSNVPNRNPGKLCIIEHFTQGLSLFTRFVCIRWLVH